MDNISGAGRSNGYAIPHGGVRPFHQLSPCLTQLRCKFGHSTFDNPNKRNLRSPPCGVAMSIITFLPEETRQKSEIFHVSPRISYPKPYTKAQPPLLLSISRSRALSLCPLSLKHPKDSDLSCHSPDMRSESLGGLSGGAPSHFIRKQNSIKTFLAIQFPSQHDLY